MIRDGKPVDYSGQGNTAGNLIAASITAVLFVVGLYMFNTLYFESVWVPMLGVFGLCSLAFFIPKQLTGQSNTVDSDLSLIQHTKLTLQTCKRFVVTVSARRKAAPGVCYPVLLRLDYENISTKYRDRRTASVLHRQ